MVCGRTIHKIAILVGVTSLILQILGYSCPGWVIVTVSLSAVSLSGSAVQGYGEIVSYTSIWYTKICIVGEDSTSCSHGSFHDEMDMGYRLSPTLNDLRHLNWTEVEIELTLAVIFCIIGLVLAVIGLLNNPGISPKVMTSLASATILVSWVLILPAVIKVGLAIQDTRTAIKIYERNNGISYTEVSTPWALALSATGLIVGLICCVLLLLRSCNLDEKTSGTITPETPRHAQPDRKDGNHYNYPVTISKIFMRENTEPHIAPQYNQGVLPAIGSKDNAPLERPDFGLTAYPDEPRIDYDDSVSLPPGTPPLDTALYPSRDSSRQNTTVGDVIRVENKQNNTGTDTHRAESNQSRPTGNANVVCEKEKIENSKLKITKTEDYNTIQQVSTGTDTQQTESNPSTGDANLVREEEQIQNSKRESTTTEDYDITNRTGTDTQQTESNRSSGDANLVCEEEQIENGEREITRTEDNGTAKQLSPTNSIELKHDNNSRAKLSHSSPQKSRLAKDSSKEIEGKPVVVQQPAHRDKTRKLSPYKTSPKKSTKTRGTGLEFV